MERLCRNCMWWGFTRMKGEKEPTRAVCAMQIQKAAEAGRVATIKTTPDESCKDFELSSQSQTKE